MPPPLPANEPERLAALRSYRVLDTASERSFDDLTRLAAAICSTPISLISLVDESRQWFKSRVGLEVTETPRSVAFCAHAIVSDEILIVPDATKDDRFSANPLVLGDPHVRFYAGVPLTVSDGVRLGTLCVIDRRPRQLSEQQVQALEVLRDAVTTQLELRRALDDLRSLEHLIPMCSWCRRIRLGDGSWQPLHEFVQQLAPVTHGACPTCARNVLAAEGIGS